MLLNTQLRDMSVEDLNQRYRHTYFLYGGKAVYCDGFIVMKTGGVGIGVAEDPDHGADIKPFDWTALDIERPQSRWYDTEDDNGKFPFFLAYNICRQWQRGLSRKNTFIYNPWGHDRNAFTTHKRALENVQPREWRDRLTTEQLNNALEDKGFYILCPQIMVSQKYDDPHIYYRTDRIGEWDMQKGAFLWHSTWTQEILEVVTDAKINILPQRQPVNTRLPLKPRFNQAPLREEDVQRVPVGGAFLDDWSRLKFEGQIGEDAIPPNRVMIGGVLATEMPNGQIKILEVWKDRQGRARVRNAQLPVDALDDMIELEQEEEPNDNNWR